jgi:hypothetical protein
MDQQTGAVFEIGFKKPRFEWKQMTQPYKKLDIPFLRPVSLKPHHPLSLSHNQACT